jgi:hypothetical protein
VVDADTGTAELTKLDGIWCVTGDVRIAITVESLESIRGLRQVLGDLWLHQGWTDAHTPEPFSELERVGGVLRISGVESPTSFEAFGGLVEVGSLHFVLTQFYADLTGFHGLTEIPGQLHIHGSVVFSSFHGLNVKHIGKLTIESAYISNLVGLSELRTVGDVELLGARSLATFEGLEALESVERLVADTPDLETLEALQNADITEALTLRGSSLVNLDGLQGVDSLTSLTIENNPSLTDLSALVLPGGATHVIVRNNPLLPACEVEALLTRSGSTCEDCSGNDGAGTCD